MSSSSKQTLYVVIVLLLVSIVLLLRKPNSPAKATNVHEGDSQSGSQVASPVQETKGTDGEKVSEIASVNQPDNDISARQQIRLQEITANLDKLQLLLDDHEKNDELLEFAISMMKRTKEEKLAALNAFQWIGGPVSIKETIAALTDTSEVANRASDVLHHLIQTDLASEEMGMTPEFWQDLFNNLPADGRDPYLVLLTAYPVEECFPVLLTLMESQDESLRESALEYASTIAEGLELTNREEAEKWFNAYLAKEATQEKQQEEHNE